MSIKINTTKDFNKTFISNVNKLNELGHTKTIVQTDSFINNIENNIKKNIYIVFYHDSYDVEVTTQIYDKRKNFNHYTKICERMSIEETKDWMLLLINNKIQETLRESFETREDSDEEYISKLSQSMLNFSQSFKTLSMLVEDSIKNNNVYIKLPKLNKDKRPIVIFYNDNIYKVDGINLLNSTIHCYNFSNKKDSKDIKLTIDTIISFEDLEIEEQMNLSVMLFDKLKKRKSNELTSKHKFNQSIVKDKLKSIGGCNCEC